MISLIGSLIGIALIIIGMIESSLGLIIIGGLLLFVFGGVFFFHHSDDMDWW